MKRKAPPALIWSGSHYTYFWQDAEWTDDPLWYRDAELWFRWLSAHHSFSFQGQHGHLNLLKEARLRGEEGYWYAYRSQGKRPTQKYAGRSAALTIERLEEIAWRLTHETAIDSGMLEQNNPTSERKKASVQNEREAISLVHFDSSIALIREQQQMSLLLPKLQLPPLPPSLVDASSKRLSEARKHLRFVVAQVCSQGYMRLFLDEGEPMQTLLQALVPTLREETQRTYLRHLLLAFVQGRASEAASDQMVLTEPLSHQEQRVLQRLCAGQTNQEIANELVVSVNTVRTQVRSIYQKLNVKNRVEASELAHQLNLL